MDPGVLRRFDSASIQEAVLKELATLPEGTKGALIAHADTRGGMSVSVMGRFGEHWSVVAEAVKPYHGPLSAQAAVVRRW